MQQSQCQSASTPMTSQSQNRQTCKRSNWFLHCFEKFESNFEKIGNPDLRVNSLFFMNNSKVAFSCKNIIDSTSQFHTLYGDQARNDKPTDTWKFGISITIFVSVAVWLRRMGCIMNAWAVLWPLQLRFRVKNYVYRHIICNIVATVRGETKVPGENQHKTNTSLATSSHALNQF